MADRLVERCAPLAGARVLDVGAGTGNVAHAALRAGAAGAVAVEPEPKLLAAGRERLPDVEWVDGRASALPFEDGSFECVLSVFAAIFDPEHEGTAAELARVCRPGGMLGLTAWLAEGTLAEVAAVLHRDVPPPPPGAGSPLAWGDEQYVRSRLERHGLDVTVTRETAAFESESLDARVRFEEAATTSWAAARERVGDEAWPELRDELAALLAAGNEATDGRFRLTSPYLLVTGRRAG